MPTGLGGYMTDTEGKRLDEMVVPNPVQVGLIARPGLQLVGDLTNSLGINGVLSYYDYLTSGCMVCGSLSYMGSAMPKTNGRFRFAGLAGHVGYTSTQLLAYLPDVLATNWNFVHLQVITNDVATGVPFATTKANIITMVEQILAAGKTPILPTAPALGSPVSGNTGPILAALTKINLWVKAYAAAMHLPMPDYHAVTVNPADNNPISMGTFWNADGVHPLAPGAKAMGDELARVLNTVLTRSTSPLAGSYNPNLMLPDAVITSAGSDKFTYSGNTGGGWGLKAITGPFWKGNQVIINRGSVGDYAATGPIGSGLWVPGNKVRVGFGIDVSACPSGGSWSASLYNFTQAQAICGFSGMVNTMTNRSVSVTDCVTTTGVTAQTINSASGQFRPTHVGCAIQINSGVTTVLPAGTTIVNVSMDGKQAYLSAGATVAASGLCATVSGEPCIAAFEFTVQPDMAGDTIGILANAAGAAGTVVGLSQPTVPDITALGVVA